jgi:hypothetical protein
MVLWYSVAVTSAVDAGLATTQSAELAQPADALVVRCGDELGATEEG